MNRKKLIDVDENLWRQFKTVCDIERETVKDVLTALIKSYVSSPRKYVIERSRKTKFLPLTKRI